ncbi:dihydrofolate reductase [Pacificibacter marinus]|uniref:Dihydrofolate reductase n=1 Tax=Pacificibacter marinus TaxID=658057 RepID=A0A1Y5SRC1_9RHOB|nr:dihydrofolate reductase [Pacificibacter marinus]SEK67202.1 dihydrofolate reductase [Pacificibacter marinus]SLN46410.1 Dihydrofolate reductase [Pacificibacter marinus]
MITLIVARDRNGAIGKDNEIPWYAPEDLAFFKRETLGGACIMGRNTWDSLPFKPLKNRLNIVVSSQGVDHEHVFPTLEGAIKFAKDQAYGRVYGMGGFGIYQAMLPLADRLLITEVDLEIEQPDTFFPEFDTADWTETTRMCLRSDGPRCDVVERLRKVKP